MFGSSDSAVFWAQTGVAAAAVLFPILWGLWKIAQKNTEEHATTGAKLDSLSEKVEVVREGVRDIRNDLTTHLENHGKDH